MSFDKLSRTDIFLFPFPMEQILEAEVLVWCSSCKPYRDCCMFCYLNWKYSVPIKQLYSVNTCAGVMLQFQIDWWDVEIVHLAWHLDCWFSSGSSWSWLIRIQRYPSLMFLWLDKSAQIKTVFIFFLLNLYLVAFLQLTLWPTVLV